MGIDVASVERVARALRRHGDRFSERVLTGAERAELAARSGDRATAIAGRFAAKEAAAKALGTGIGDVQWVDIEIVNGARGEPKLVFHGAAQVRAEKLGLKEWSVSLSHTREHAVALVIARGH